MSQNIPNIIRLKCIVIVWTTNCVNLMITYLRNSWCLFADILLCNRIALSRVHCYLEPCMTWNLPPIPLSYSRFTVWLLYVGSFYNLLWCLTGGLLCQGISELTGESACGKTQICMQLALNSQLVKRNDKFCSKWFNFQLNL